LPNALGWRAPEGSPPSPAVKLVGLSSPFHFRGNLLVDFRKILVPAGSFLVIARERVGMFHQVQVFLLQKSCVWVL
jgi:hypothetical protein